MTTTTTQHTAVELAFKPWVTYSQGVAIVESMGYSLWNFKKLKHLVEQRKLPKTVTRYSRDSIIKIFS
tara:strand:- start:2592 stop:2795 length:204 start_codon:yes stop_codon:yes gene_type:complete